MSTTVRSNCHNGTPSERIRVVRKRVASLKPSPENSLLYRQPGSDPDHDSFVESIRTHGLLEHLIVTADNFIVAGHRRQAALIEIGRVFVRCRVLRARRDAMTRDEYVALLREHNRQRNKSVAEQVAEELVDINPEAAVANLRNRRSKFVEFSQCNGVTAMNVEGSKTRFAISEQKADHVKYVKQVVFEDLREYWPLSVRGVHYALLNYRFFRNKPRKLAYANDDQSYGATSDLITRLRLEGAIPWKAFDDPTRPLKDFRAFGNVRQFIRQEADRFCDGYWRDYLQSQPNHIEVICEKNTIYHMVLRVTSEYQIPTSSGRGFSSIDPWHDLFERYESSGKDRLIVIVLSDFDPEGEMIPHVGGRTLRDDFGVDADKLTIIKAGVTREQIGRYKLPSQNFAKETSSNHEWFVGRNGGDDAVYELEALKPADMLRDLEYVVKSVIEVDLFERELAAERQEAVYLDAAKAKALRALKGLLE
jgi:hypothetical protein